MTTAETHEQPVATGIALTALDPAFRENPYPILADLRRREPVHVDDQLKRYVFTRHDDVQEILRDLSLWSDPRRAAEGTFTREFLARGREGEEPSMLLMDDPGHRRLRNLVKASFTPKAIERWRPRAHGIAEEMVAALDADEFELIGGLAGPLPSRVIAEVLGVDADRHEAFKEWSDILVRVGFNPIPTPDAVAAGAKAGAALDQFFLEEIEARRANPGQDLLSDLLRAEEEGDQLTDTEVVTMCNLLLIAGNVTTTDLIGNAVKALIDFPDEQAKLRARVDLLPNAVEEALRYDSPVVNSGRVASREMQIGGVTIAEGQSLSVSLAAANRDPAVYPDPDRFDVEREDTHHQSFGGGRHFCLGSHLAKLEAQEALGALLRRFEDLALGAGGYEYAATPSFRGFEHLGVKGRTSRG